MDGRTRITPLGWILLAVLALALVGVFVGSRAIQSAGFIVAVIVVLVLIAGGLPLPRLLSRLPWMDSRPEEPPHTARRHDD